MQKNQGESKTDQKHWRTSTVAPQEVDKNNLGPRIRRKRDEIQERIAVANWRLDE